MLTQTPLERVETAQHTWTFDRIRRLFCRVPRGIDPDDPSTSLEWQPYFSMSIDADRRGFIVSLDASGTRLLRAGIA